MEPTHLGRLFLAGAEEILQSARDLQREIDLPRGLEIGSSVGPADLHMGTTEGRLSHGYPRLNIYLEVNDYAGFTHLLQSPAYETCQTAPKQEQGRGHGGRGCDSIRDKNMQILLGKFFCQFLLAASMAFIPLLAISLKIHKI